MRQQRCVRTKIGVGLIGLGLVSACAAASEGEATAPAQAGAADRATDVVVSPPPAEQGAQTRPAAPRAAPSAAPRLLPALCEDYFVTMDRCWARALEGVPDSEREQAAASMAKASATTREAWAQIEDTSALESACKAALDALAANPSCAP